MFKLVIGELELLFTDPESLMSYLKQKRVEFDSEEGLTVYLAGYILSPHTGRKEWVGPVPDPVQEEQNQEIENEDENG